MNKIVILDKGPHYAKEVTDDGKFVKFVANPNGSYRDECRHWLELAESADNNRFVQGLRLQFDKKHSLSPKQVACLKDIYARTNFEKDDNFLLDF